MMAAPSGITLTPNSGVAPFAVQISGTDLFERPDAIGRETFSLGDNGISTDGGILCWSGTNPTRVDGKIGKAISCASTGPRYFMARNRVAGSENTVTSGYNALFPITITAQFYVSVWIKLDSAANHSIYDLWNSSSTGSHTMIAGNGIGDMLGLAINAQGRLMAIIAGKDGANAQAKRKIIYSDANSIIADTTTWHNIVFTWNGVALDLPKLYVDGTNIPCTALYNDSIVGLYYASVQQYNNLKMGYGNGFSGDTPGTFSNAAGTYLNGSICDFNIGNKYLTPSDVLKFSNLPKVELLKVV